jgi:serine O-acetyltransferase
MKEIQQLIDLVFQHNNNCDHEAPSYKKTKIFVDDFIEFLFPIKSDNPHTLSKIEASAVKIKAQFQELLFPIKNRISEPVEDLTDKFFKMIPGIYESLLNDASESLNFDPAAYSKEEVILCYPGFYTIAVYRLAHVLYELEIPMLPRMMSEYAHSRTGIDIHPGAKIGKNFFIDHGTGVVIGETTNIGDNVKIYQGVTLGALSVSKELAKKKRHPTIEDNVIIYSGSSILGGETVVGRNTIIGGNVWLTSSVLPFSVVYHKSRTVVRNSKDFTEPINFVI